MKSENVLDQLHPISSDLVSALRTAAPQSEILSDAESRSYYANDIFWQPGVAPDAIVLPATAAEAAAAVGAATRLGHAIVPRGGGMSYTKGYLPDGPGAVVIDTRRLDKVIEVNTGDLYVTVEAGCTWEKLREALEGTGLRTPYWGPLSGQRATIGGALSQNSAFFGSTNFATVADSVLGVTVALADGSLVTTGSGGRKGTLPFTREGGPDLTGLFLGDTGALGLKLSATLRLIKAPTEEGWLSFGFSGLGDMVKAQTEMAVLRSISEGFGIDRTKATHSASVNKLMDGIKTLGNVMRGGKTLLEGVKNAASVAAGGTSFLKEHNYTLHLVIEGRSPSDLKERLEEIRQIGRRYGKEIENTVPKVMRSKPFGPPRGMLGANGERWVPIHSVFPMSTAEAVVKANDAFFEEQRPFMEKHGIVYSVMSLTVGNEFFLEPAFYWMDEITPLHAKTLGQDVVAPWLSRPAAPETRAAVAELRAKTQALYLSLGGVNWQIARDYPFSEVLQPQTLALLQSVKSAVDPRGLMNPGALGLKGE